MDIGQILSAIPNNLIGTTPNFNKGLAGFVEPILNAPLRGEGLIGQLGRAVLTAGAFNQNPQLGLGVMHAFATFDQSLRENAQRAAAAGLTPAEAEETYGNMLPYDLPVNDLGKIMYAVPNEMQAQENIQQMQMERTSPQGFTPTRETGQQAEAANLPRVAGERAAEAYGQFDDANLDPDAYNVSTVFGPNGVQIQASEKDPWEQPADPETFQRMKEQFGQAGFDVVSQPITRADGSPGVLYKPVPHRYGPQSSDLQNKFMIASRVFPNDTPEQIWERVMNPKGNQNLPSRKFPLVEQALNERGMTMEQDKEGFKPIAAEAALGLTNLASKIYVPNPDSALITKELNKQGIKGKEAEVMAKNFMNPQTALQAWTKLIRDQQDTLFGREIKGENREIGTESLLAEKTQEFIDKGGPENAPQKMEMPPEYPQLANDITALESLNASPAAQDPGSQGVVSSQRNRLESRISEANQRLDNNMATPDVVAAIPDLAGAASVAFETKGPKLAMDTIARFLSDRMPTASSHEKRKIFLEIIRQMQVGQQALNNEQKLLLITEYMDKIE